MKNENYNKEILAFAIAIILSDCFQLAMDYLLDPGGLGKSNDDVLNLFYDVRNGDEFEVTFQRNFDISLQNFEDEFFDRMRGFIGES